MAGQDISIASGDGTFTGYLATPDAGSGAGVVVIQEIFGVNDVMRQITDHWAAQGFFALCPDLFWRQEPGIQITDKSEEEWQKAFQLYQGFNADKGVDDITATMQVLRAVDGCNGRIGGTGYCLGGYLAYLMACRTDADCAVGYYGVGIENALSEADNIHGACMLHIAEEDGFVPKEAQQKISSALADNAGFTVHSYPGMDHAFCRTGGEHYDPANADLANGRTLAFFNQHLG